MRKFTFLTIVIVNHVEQILIEVIPLLKSEFLAEHSRSNVACNQCRFNGNCTRTTHRVY